MKKEKALIIVIVALIINFTSSAQVGIGTSTPDGSSILDLTSTSQGVLAPRMTSAQRTAIASPAEGLLVFDTDESSFYFFNASSWTKLIGENRVNDYTGWADYVDGTYTSANPLV